MASNPFVEGLINGMLLTGLVYAIGILLAVMLI